MMVPCGVPAMSVTMTVCAESPRRFHARYRMRHLSASCQCSHNICTASRPTSATLAVFQTEPVPHVHSSGSPSVWWQYHDGLTCQGNRHQCVCIPYLAG